MSITITPANNITITLGAQGPAGQDGEDGNVTSATETDIDGILKGDGATISAAVAGVDYVESASIPDELTDLDTTVTGAQLDSLKTKVDGIEAGADVTDTTNVTAAGALMDSEVTNLAEVKAFDPTDYATAAQGATADTSIQPADISGLTGGTTGQIATKASGDDYDLTWADDLTVPGLLTADHIHGNIAGTLYIHVKNTSGGTLAKGTPVYVTGHVGSSDRVEVAAADQSDPAKMPAIALLAEELPDNGEGDGVIVGEIRTFDTVTPGYALNDELFVGTAALTDTKPTTGVVQPVATVARLQSSTGVLVINCQGQRSPDETFATAAQGALADTSTQPGDNVSTLVNDAGYSTTTGTVTSIAVSGSDGLEIDSGSPVTSSGTIALGIDKATLLAHINVEDGATADPVSTYLGPVTLTSATSIAWDVDSGTSANLADLAHDTTVTLSNLADGEEFSLAGTQDGTGGRALTIAHSGLTVRGDTSGIAGLTADDAFVVVGRRSGTDLLLSVQTYEIT